MSSIESEQAEKTSYRQVNFKKEVGNLNLTSEGLAFYPSTTDGTAASTTALKLQWNNITKHQVSPANYPKALLKLITNENKKGLTFQLYNREELERIRKDITVRLRLSRSGSTRSSLDSHNKSRNDDNSKAIDTTKALALVTTKAPKLSGNKRAYAEILQSTSNRDINGLHELDSSALTATRAAVLAANPSLRSQHELLVEEGKTVSEEDFWKTHEQFLQEEYARAYGMARARTSSLSQSHLSGRVTLSIEEMRQIFILYPAVHKAYEEKVPLELSEEEFWRKYLESEYFHRDRGLSGEAKQNHPGSVKEAVKLSVGEKETHATVNGTADLFSRYDQELNDTTKPNKPNGKKWGSKLGVGQFDLASTYQTERGDLLEGPKDNHPANKSDRGARVISKYNRHWAMILHPRDAVAGSDLMSVARRSAQDVLKNDEDAKASGGLHDEMIRLVEFSMASERDANHAQGIGIFQRDEYEHLTLKHEYSCDAQEKKYSYDSVQRFTKELASQLHDLASKEQEMGHKGDIGCFTSAMLPQKCFPPPDLGHKLLVLLTEQMAQDCNTNLEVVDALPEGFKKRLHSYFLRSSELLRHFFGLRKLDAKGAKSGRQKLNRIVTGMEAFHREMEKISREAPESDVGETMRKMYLPLINQLDWAFMLHRERVSGRKGRSG